MGNLTNGKVIGYDKGFRFIVKSDSFVEFTNGLKMQFRRLIDL